MVVRRLDAEEHFRRELLHVRCEATESRWVKLLGEIEKRRADFVRRYDLTDAEGARWPLRDAQLHLREHGARSGFVVPSHSQIVARRLTREKPITSSAAALHRTS